jgi:hypothetical protein
MVYVGGEIDKRIVCESPKKDATLSFGTYLIIVSDVIFRASWQKRRLV